MKLLTSQSYLDAPQELRDKVCNDCGPEGLIGKLVPEHLLGTDISTACNIHDWMYQEGEDRQKADLFFLTNMVLLCSTTVKNILLTVGQYELKQPLGRLFFR